MSITAVLFLVWPAGLSIVLMKACTTLQIICSIKMASITILYDAIKRATASNMLTILKETYFAAILAGDGKDQGNLLQRTHLIRKFAFQYTCNK